MVEDTTFLETPVKIEFNIAKEVVEFNVREHLLKLLHEMQAFDNSLRIQSSIEQSIEWADLNSFPEGDDFSEHFQLKDFNFRTHKKVIVHMKVVSLSTVNRIKYSGKVKDHIYQQNIWIKTDRYNAKVESSPGYFTMVHPKLVHREELTNDLITVLQALKPNRTEQVVQDWYDIHVPNTQYGEEPAKVPPFHIESSIKKWGRVKTEVLRVTCSKDDSEYLKYLLSLASEKEQLSTAIFVPAGLHLMEGKYIVFTC